MNLIFKVQYEATWAELLRMKGWKLGLLGNQAAVGNWCEEQVLLLNTTDFRFWEMSMNITACFLEYKYVLYNPQTSKVVAWEVRLNRQIEVLEDGNLEIQDENIHFDIPLFKGAGVAIPVFSLRSKEGFGVGEFLDLKKMIDWAVITGQQMIQTLPINDTTLQHTEADSYPYNSLSVFALHPMYLRLEGLGKLRDKRKQTYFEKQREFLNSLSIVNYKRVNELKWDYFRLIYVQERAAIFASEEYQNFISENKVWLLPYAVFCFLRDKNRTSDFSTWKFYKKYSATKVDYIAGKYPNEVGLYMYLQYQLQLQLSEVHAYAKAKGILLKGDIPIGVSPYSVDAWCNPLLFNTKGQAGAPPDDFSEKGQNWGFPTYNWEEMAKDDFVWWKARLQNMSKYFDAYRIDHILGFFRIWEIPQSATWGLLGHFNKALPFTVKEIESYGLRFISRYLQPYITDEVLFLYFGDRENEIKETYLLVSKNGKYRLKKEFSTQRKVETYFRENWKDSHLKDGLLRLICQVLFVKDNGMYHPRISYHENEAYKALNEKDKQAYKSLYDDFFYYRHNVFWQQQAMEKLPALLSATSMLSCGEDLGMIPACVPDVMKSLHLLTLEIQRMPKTFGQEFGLPSEAPYLSVCTTSTHDMSPLRLWWMEETPERRQLYYNSVLKQEGDAPQVCSAELAETIIQQHLESPAMWVVLPLQDWLAIDTQFSNVDPATERVNVPDNPNNIWCYRMYLNLDDLLQANKYNKKIGDLIEIERM